MFARLASLAVVALAIGARADVVVSTPGSITQCQPVTFQISGSSTGPFYAFFVDGTNPCGDALDELDNISGSSFTWTPKVAPGTSIMVALESEDGTEGWSGAVTVGAGDSSCLSGASSAAATTPATTASPTTLVANVAHTTSHTASVVPVNAATDLPASGSSNGAGSRAVVGFGSALALVGAAVAAFAL